MEYKTFLADALGITPEALQEAREQVNAATLAEIVESGLMTQEQLDSMQAHQAVRQYLDLDGLRESAQAAYEAAVEQAVAAGAVTQAQADELLSNFPGLGLLRFGGRGPGGRAPGGHGPGGRGFSNPDGFAPFRQAPATTAPGHSNT